MTLKHEIWILDIKCEVGNMKFEVGYGFENMKREMWNMI